MFTNFTTGPLARWQTQYKMMFARPKGQVNIMYDVEAEVKGQPWQTRPVKDWDPIFKDGESAYYVALGRLGIAVDAGTRSYPEVIGIPSFDRGLMDLFLIALRDYWMGNEKHLAMVHPSWHSTIEGYKG
jgi:hypothetical protein